MSAADTIFEKRGVTLSLLQAVRDLALSIKPNPDYWSIGRLSAALVGNHEILKPSNRWGKINPEDTLTHADQCSLIEVLRKHHSVNPHPKLGMTYAEVGKANVFISFAYSSDFMELVNSIECYMERNPHKHIASTFFWFDLFVNDQWTALTKSFEWWANTFRIAVEEIGETLLILTPWYDPDMLKRAWCLFEISCSKLVTIALSRKQLEAFKVNYNENCLFLLSKLGNIDLQKATAFIPEDRDRIFEVVRNKEGGFQSFNVNIINLLHEWISDAARSLVAGIHDESMTFEEMSNLQKTSTLLKQQGDYEESIVMMERIAIQCERLLIKSRNSGLELVRLQNFNNLGVCHRRNLALQKAEVYFEMALPAYEKAFGSEVTPVRVRNIKHIYTHPKSVKISLEYQ